MAPEPLPNQPERQPDSTEAEEWERKAIELGVGFFRLATSDPGRRAERAEHERDEAHSSAEHWHDRAEQAESQRDALQARLEEVRAGLRRMAETPYQRPVVDDAYRQLELLHNLAATLLTTTSDTKESTELDAEDDPSTFEPKSCAGVDDGSGPRASGGHRVEIDFDSGAPPFVRLIHPGTGCPEGEEGEDCWLTDWLENEGAELLRGKVTLPVRWAVEDDRDHPLFHLLAVDSPAPERSKETGT